MRIVVQGWFHETREGPRCRFACIEYDHFGFALPEAEAEDLATQLGVLLKGEEADASPDGMIVVEWSAEVDGWVMIGFRPVHECQGRFYDIPRDAAEMLLRELRKLLANPSLTC